MGNENLVTNGTFTGEVPANSWKNVTADSSPAPKGWEPILPGGYDWLSGGIAKHDDNIQAVDLGAEYNPNGGVKQTISTTREAKYELTFEHSPNPYGNCANYPMDFTVKIVDDESDSEIKSQHFSLGVAPTPAAPKWKKGNVPFTAESDSTAILFCGNEKTSCQAAITNVSVHLTEAWLARGH